MIDYLAMGGYGFYVWGSYGVTALVILTEVMALRARRRRAMMQARSGEYDAISVEGVR
jgi:heme exporter protein D